MKGEAYFRKLADRYEAIAPTMRSAKDRETVAAIAAQYRQKAEEAQRRRPRSSDP
jgi:hypothetical protein